MELNLDSWGESGKFFALDSHNSRECSEKGNEKIAWGDWRDRFHSWKRRIERSVWIIDLARLGWRRRWWDSWRRSWLRIEDCAQLDIADGLMLDYKTSRSCRKCADRAWSSSTKQCLCILYDFHCEYLW